MATKHIKTNNNIDLKQRAQHFYKLACKYQKKGNDNIALDIFKKIQREWDGIIYAKAQLEIAIYKSYFN